MTQIPSSDDFFARIGKIIVFFSNRAAQGGYAAGIKYVEDKPPYGSLYLRIGKFANDPKRWYDLNFEILTEQINDIKDISVLTDSFEGLFVALEKKIEDDARSTRRR